MSKLSNRKKGTKKEQEFMELLKADIAKDPDFKGFKLLKEWASPTAPFQDNDALGWDIMLLYHDKYTLPHCFFAQVKKAFNMKQYLDYKDKWGGSFNRCFYATYGTKKFADVERDRVRKLGEFNVYTVN